MITIIKTIVILSASTLSLPTHANYNALSINNSKEVDSGKLISYEQAFKTIDSTLHNNAFNREERSKAYIKRGILFKQLFNAAAALHNFNLAISETFPINESNKWIKDWAKLEKMLIYYDINHEEKFNQLSNTYKKSIIPKEVNTLHSIIKSIDAMRAQDFTSSLELLEKVNRIALQESPIYLPIIYRLKMRAYSKLNKSEKVIKEFNLGIQQAKYHQLHYSTSMLYQELCNHYLFTKNFSEYARYHAILTGSQEKALAIHSNEIIMQSSDSAKDDIAIEENYILPISCSLSFILSCFLGILFLKKRKNRAADDLYTYLPPSEPSETLYNQVQLTSTQDYNKLTERQYEIIRLVKLGMTNKQIGSELYISENTVKYHLKGIFELLNISNRNDL